jgi:hypothetical protein
MIHQKAEHRSAVLSLEASGDPAESATLTHIECLAPSFNASAQSEGSVYGSDAQNFDTL